MTEHNLFYYPYGSFTNTQLPLLKVAALWFDKLVILDLVGANWDTVGADHGARDAARQLKGRRHSGGRDTGQCAGEVTRLRSCVDVGTLQYCGWCQE